MNEPASVDSTSDARVANNVVRHEYRVLSDAEKAQMKRLKDLSLAFIEACDEIGSSREMSLAKTNAEQAVMWAVKHVTRSVLMLLFFTLPAFAQAVVSPAAPSAPTIDLTSPVNDILALLLAAVTAAIPIVVPALLKRLGVANNADLAQTVDKAATAGAGMAYTYALSHEGGLSSLTVRNAALAAGINHVATSVPEALTKLGITPASVEAMVTARLGVLLASDPSVTAGAPPKTPVTTPVAAAPNPAPAPAPVPNPAPAPAPNPAPAPGAAQ
jgi:hypothetical protein